MKKKMLLWVFAAVMLLGGCGGSSKGFSTESANTATSHVTSNYSMDVSAPAEEMEEADAGESGGVSVSQVQKKLIVTERINVETKEFDTFVNGISQKTEDLGGYIETSEMSGTKEYGNRSANFTIRIPADKLADFVTVVEETAAIVYESKTTEDVTLQYVDTESYLKALKTEEKTLLSLLEKAEKLSDVFDIQARLTEVRYQLESFESQLRVMDNQIDYSTIHLNVSEVSRESTPVKKGFFAEAAAEFSDNLYFVGQAVRGFGIWLIGNIPVFVLLGAIAVVVLFMIKRYRAKRQLKKNMMNMEPDDLDNK